MKVTDIKVWISGTENVAEASLEAFELDLKN